MAATVLIVEDERKPRDLPGPTWSGLGFEAHREQPNAHWRSWDATWGDIATTHRSDAPACLPTGRIWPAGELSEDLEPRQDGATMTSLAALRVPAMAIASLIVAVGAIIFALASERAWLDGTVPARPVPAATPPG